MTNPSRGESRKGSSLSVVTKNLILFKDTVFLPIFTKKRYRTAAERYRTAVERYRTAAERYRTAVERYRTAEIFCFSYHG